MNTNPKVPYSPDSTWTTRKNSRSDGIAGCKKSSEGLLNAGRQKAEASGGSNGRQGTTCRAEPTERITERRPRRSAISYMIKITAERGDVLVSGGNQKKIRFWGDRPG